MVWRGPCGSEPAAVTMAGITGGQAGSQPPPFRGFHHHLRAKMPLRCGQDISIVPHVELKLRLIGESIQLGSFARSCSKASPWANNLPAPSVAANVVPAAYTFPSYEALISAWVEPPMLVQAQGCAQRFQCVERGQTANLDANVPELVDRQTRGSVCLLRVSASKSSFALNR
jgi:hypothetical protein